MTYFGFLIVFLGIPLAILAAATWRDWRRERRPPPDLNNQPGWLVLLLHVALAVIWTTPWDNYLVATGVWYYDPALVTGITIGWVPVEEYLFFVLQTLMTGLWLLWLIRHLRPAPMPAPRRRTLRFASAAVVGAVWLASILALLAKWTPGAYLALEAAWLLLPVILQLLVGGDLLWHHRRLVLSALLLPWLYLCLADFVAIGSGTWTIDPAQSTGIMVGGVLPIEEVIFFLLTNMLIVFGMTLFLAIDRREVGRVIDRYHRKGSGAQAAGRAAGRDGS
jgi:lycopene cyclase domain-containing protein